MGLRGTVRTVIGSVVSFGEVTSALASGLLTVLESADDDDADRCQYYGDAALLSRPPKGADALFVDLDGERVVFGTRETRWVVSLEEGDTVLRALGATTRAYLRLRKNGDVEIMCGDKATASLSLKASGAVQLNATTLKLGGDSASMHMALAELVEAQLNTLKAAINAAQPGVQDGGAAFKTALMIALSTWPASTASSAVTSL